MTGGRLFPENEPGPSSIIKGQLFVECRPIDTQTTPTRVLGTVYQNTSQKTRLVTVTLTVTYSGAQGDGTAYCDSAAAPTTVVGQIKSVSSIADGITATITFAVLPNYYYKVSQVAGSVTKVAWVEWY